VFKKGVLTDPSFSTVIRYVSRIVLYGEFSAWNRDLMQSAGVHAHAAVAPAVAPVVVEHNGERVS